MQKLAIYSPNLGALSETFIKKHIEDILPGNTVVVAGSNDPPRYGHWSVDAPTYIDRIITVSEYSKDVLIKSGIKKELIHVIPCGISLPPYINKVHDGKFIKCIAVGRMVPKKGPLLLLESFLLASKKNDLLTLDFI